MFPREKRIDNYIDTAADFAKPILIHLRELIHKTCPEIEEKIKWSFPHFDYNGEMLCSMASFKNHCAFGFWKAALLSGSIELIANAESESAMGNFGPIKKLKDLPTDAIIKKYIKESMKLNEKGIKLPPKAKSSQKELVIPGYFKQALIKNKKASITFTNFSPSNKKEYVEWVAEAKTEQTKLSRLETAIEWMAEGKVRNWKYMKK